MGRYGGDDLLSESSAPDSPEPENQSASNPLSNAQFRNMWVASTVSNIGGWMQDTAGIWLMTAMTSAPLPVALMQTAATLPVVALGLLAGASADIFDRRRLLLLWQSWMLAVVVILTVLSFANLISPWILLGLTFLLNVGGAMNGAAWQSVVPELVSHDDLPNAVALNSAGFNLARSVGPALGGLCVALFRHAVTGAAFTFLLNAVSFVGVICVLNQWKRRPLFKSALPAERIVASMSSGIHFVRHFPPLKALLSRAFVFTFFVSAVWALLAIVAAHELHRGALGYGILNGSMGVGAVFGAVTLSSIRRKSTPDTILLTSTFVFITTLPILAFGHLGWGLIPILMMAGFAWTATMSTLNLAVQLSIPSWVQARAIGIYQTVFSAGLAIGSIVWGTVAQHISTSASLTLAAAGLLLSVPVTLTMRLPPAQAPDFAPLVDRSVLDQFASQSNLYAGPVRLHIDYRVLEANYENFVLAIYQLREVRLRNGAIRWGVFQDLTDATRLSETFIMESWVDYLRQRERLTVTDGEILTRIAALDCTGTVPIPAVTLYVRQNSRPVRGDRPT